VVLQGIRVGIRVCPPLVVGWLRLGWDGGRQLAGEACRTSALAAAACVQPRNMLSGCPGPRACVLRGAGVEPWQEARLAEGEALTWQLRAGLRSHQGQGLLQLLRDCAAVGAICGHHGMGHLVQRYLPECGSVTWSSFLR
jgi:hypothetical protein